MFTPNLDPMYHAMCNCDTKEESDCLSDMISALENDSIWPRWLYECGGANCVLGPMGFQALGTVVAEFKEYGRKIKARKVLGYSTPKRTKIRAAIEGDDLSSDDDLVILSDKQPEVEADVVDLVSNSVTTDSDEIDDKKLLEMFKKTIKFEVVDDEQSHEPVKTNNKKALRRVTFQTPSEI